jgi:predicted CXXCH cytochrome family protein
VPAGLALHEAVVKQQCTTCHTPHRSPRPHLIRALAEELCLKCHKPEEFRGPRHPVVTRADCLLCHRGHWSLEPHLLKPEIPRLAETATAPSTTSASTRETGTATRPGDGG